MTQTCDGEMVVRCVSTWQILDSNYAIVKVLFKPDVRASSNSLMDFFANADIIILYGQDIVRQPVDL